MSIAGKILLLLRGMFVLCLAASVVAGCAPATPVPRGAPPDVELTQACSAAMSAYERGELEQAAFLYRRALARSRAIDTPDAIADAAYNLGACEAALEHYEQADRLLREAEYETSRAEGDVTEVLLLRAKIAYLQNRVAEARALADSVISKAPRADSVGSGVGLQAMILMAQMACDEKDASAANARLAAVANEAARAATSSSVRADWMRAVGSLRLLEGKPAESAAAFDQETQLLIAAHRYREVWKSLARAARSWSDSKKSGLAADRFYRAARSAAALGETSAAKDLAASSTEAASASGDQTLLHLSQALTQELKGAAVAP